MRKKLFILAALFLVVRAITILAYKDTPFYYGMVTNQFGIAEAAYHGHWFSSDPELSSHIMTESNRDKRYIPIEDWKQYMGSGEYRTFPAQDLPGFGYLIAFTSKLFDHELTSKYAFAIQIMIEMMSVLIFVYCIYLVLGERVAFIAGLIYVFGYPFIWPLASQPMRDIFVMGIYVLYIAAFYLFKRRSDALSYCLVFVLVSLGALLLWIRPSGYYFFFIIAPLILLLKNKSIPARAFFFLLTVLLPLMIFAGPLREFNMKYYSTANTDLLGRALWEGMGIIQNNQYGFTLDDAALVPWVEKYYSKKVDYSSPEMNRLLGQYAERVIKQDPAYYLRTVFARVCTIVATPLWITFPWQARITGYFESGLPFFTFMKCYPGSFISTGISIACSFIFFHVGSLLAFLMVLRLRHLRTELVVLFAPLWYTLITQIPLHFEARYLATGAWVLTLPFGYYLNNVYETFRERKELKKCAE